MKAIDLARRLLESPTADVKVGVSSMSIKKYHDKTCYPIKFIWTDFTIHWSTTRRQYEITTKEQSK